MQVTTTITPMKRTLVTALLAIFCAVSACCQNSTAIATNNNNRLTPLSTAYSERFGVGIILGEPTGASLKYWLNDTIAIDGAIGASFNDDADDDSSFYLHSDLLWHNFDLIPVPRGRLPVYIGAGALVRFRDDEDNQVGVRIPVGLSYMFDNAPIDIFAEIAPAIDVAPDVRGEVTGGIGIRYWF
jgi:hypothetical protein